MKLKRESEVAQSCMTLGNPMDCSPPGSSVQGIFQARVLEWGAMHQGANRICQQRALQGSVCVRSVGSGGIFPVSPSFILCRFHRCPPAKTVEGEASETFGNEGSAYKAVLWGQDTGGKALDWESGIHVCRETLDTPASGSPPVK